MILVRFIEVMDWKNYRVREEYFERKMYFSRGRILEELREELDGELSDSSTSMSESVEECGGFEI